MKTDLDFLHSIGPEMGNALDVVDPVGVVTVKAVCSAMIWSINRWFIGALYGFIGEEDMAEEGVPAIIMLDGVPISTKSSMSFRTTLCVPCCCRCWMSLCLFLLTAACTTLEGWTMDNGHPTDQHQ